MANLTKKKKVARNFPNIGDCVANWQSHITANQLATAEQKVAAFLDNSLTNNTLEEVIDTF